MERIVQIMDEQTIRRSLARITHEIIERNDGSENVCVFGIKNRGVELARILCENFKKFDDNVVPLGTLDVTLRRDDLTEQEKTSKATESIIPCDIKDKTVIIVDDVLYTGRTARAAIETVFSLARPKSVQLAVLVDRGHREIPIRPDFVGKNIPTSKHEKISVVMNGENNGVYIINKEKSN